MSNKSADLYSVDKLMTQTRRLAAEYHQAMGQALPVSNEIARYDAKRLFNLHEPERAMNGVDLLSQGNGQQQRIQVKSRVIFEPKKNNYRIGQLNIDAAWDIVMLVLLDANYEPFAIYQMSRNILLQELKDGSSENKKKRGAISVAKFKALGTIVWDANAAGDA